MLWHVAHIWKYLFYSLSSKIAKKEHFKLYCYTNNYKLQKFGKTQRAVAISIEGKNMALWKLDK
jgi:hypothetical protein